MSTKPRPIKVANTAPSETMRADEIAIKIAKTGNVTAVVEVMSIFTKKICKLRSTNCGNEKPSCQKAESANFLKENTCGWRNFSQKSRSSQISKKSASKLKKLELNSTNLELKSKKTCLDCTEMPDPSVSSGLNVKNKTSWVLLPFHEQRVQ